MVTNPSGMQRAMHTHAATVTWSHFVHTCIKMEKSPHFSSTNDMELLPKYNNKYLDCTDNYPTKATLGVAFYSSQKWHLHQTKSLVMAEHDNPTTTTHSADKRFWKAQQ